MGEKVRDKSNLTEIFKLMDEFFMENDLYFQSQHPSGIRVVKQTTYDCDKEQSNDNR